LSSTPGGAGFTNVTAGAQVTLTATGSCTTGTPEYLFMVEEPTGQWSTFRTYGGDSVTWDTTYAFAANTFTPYVFYAKVRAQGSTDTWEGYSSNIYFTVSGGRLFCGAAGVTTSPPSTVAAGNNLTLIGTSSCAAGSPAEYKYMMRDPAGQWRTLRDFDTFPNYKFNTAGMLGGTYTFYNFVRRRYSAAYAKYEVVSSITFSLTGGVGYCDQATLAASPSGAITAGASVAFTAGSTCTAGATAEYRFTDLLPNGFYRTRQSWSSSNTFTWNTDASTLDGTHQVFVDVRRQGSTLNLEDRSSMVPMTVSGGGGFCTGASLAISPASPVGAGNPVTLTGSATCPGGSTPEYRFVRKGPDGLWRVARTWNTSPVFNWSTSSEQTGTHTFYFYVRQQGSSLLFEDAAGPTDFVITGGNGYCGSATLGVSPASPQSVGATLNLTAGSTCTSGTAEYLFGSRRPDGLFKHLSGWSSSSAYAWDTTGLASGTWTLFVYSRRQGSTASAEGVSSNVSYVLNP